jgi:pimeloyl-ACP methyl ester carboxylesterase
VTVVLVHGAWHGAWCWDAVVRSLAECGIEAHTLDLPSNHVDGAGFPDDVKAVRDVLDGLSDVVLCGHSYGGAVISEAGAHGAVAHLVFLCAFALDAGESTAANASPTVSSTLDTAMQIDGEAVTVDPDGARAAFYADCPTPPVDRLVAHALRAFTAEAAVAAWRDKPSTYVLCTQDRAIHPDRQRFFAGRCGTTVTLEASHSPMLSMPGRVTDILAGCHTR